jgi:hypothetical protein
MNARNVHAVLAAGVQHPNLLSEWLKDPGFLRRKGIAPETIDLAALRKFAGLTIKVKHNGLRLDFPLAFRLMSLAELDIAIFSDYAIFCAATGHRLAKTSAERACDLISFLETWLDFNQKRHSLLWDMIRYEQALACLKAAVQETPPVDSPELPSGRLRGSSVPLVRGRLVLHRMQHDPQTIRPALFQKPLRLEEIPGEEHFYGYLRSPASENVQILDLDEFGYYALTLVDGATPVAELSRRMGGGVRPTAAFKAALQQLANSGILDFRTTRGLEKR